MTRSRRAGVRSVGRRGAAVAVAGAVAATLAGVAAAPAQSAAVAACPETVTPVGALAPNQPVTGLTVSEGTQPGPFSGEVLGVIHDGIAPGVDMIMARLTSPEIDRVGGIWQGMSGSPVYDAEGGLIGAVAYGLAYGPSPVAGITPAAEMPLLRDGAAGASASHVKIPAALRKRLVKEGVGTAAQVDRGLSRLKLPFGIGGLTGAQYKKVVKSLKDRHRVDGLELMRASSGKAAAEIPIQVGGNLAASVSYGDVTFAGTGTATAVCGSEVVGFGHPLLGSGPTTLGLHGAQAVYIQEDPVSAPFKVANLGEPSGTINSDRSTGISGFFGAAPRSGAITTTTTSGDRSREGRTDVFLPDWMPDVAYAHLLANASRVFDAAGKGSGSLSWKLHGTRENGKQFTLKRSDLYASTYDIADSMAWDVAMTLYMLQYNGVEDIRIGDINADMTLRRAYRHANITRVSVASDGEWVRVKDGSTLKLRPGKVAKFKVHLVGTPSIRKQVVVTVPVPKKSAGRRGYLEVFGGNMSFEEFGGESSPAAGGADRETFDDVLKAIRTAPHHDEVVAALYLPKKAGGGREGGERTGVVVDGGIAVGVKILK